MQHHEQFRELLVSMRNLIITESSGKSDHETNQGTFSGYINYEQ